MPQISDDVHRSIDRAIALITGQARPRNAYEANLVEDDLDLEEAEDAERYGRFALTKAEMEQAVDTYWDWLSDVRIEIQDCKSEIEVLKNDIEATQDDDRARELMFDLQLELDRLSELKDERDEVEAKLQTVKRESHEVDRKVRWDQRKDRDPIDWQETNERKHEEERRAERQHRQQEQQAVRRVREHQTRARGGVESADLSDAEELLGEDEAADLRDAMDGHWQMDNDWLHEGETDEADDEQERRWNQD